jgi:hypothetical protein
MREQFVRELTRFYANNAIAVANFGCPYREQCDADAGRPLTHGVEAHVGHNYGEVTRIVVISLDTGGHTADLDERTRVIESVTPNDANPHMGGTYRFLSAILSREIGQQSPMPFYAMLNSAKCSGSDGKMDTVNWSLHRRCRGFAVGEVAVLDPQIVWLQGRMVKDIFGSSLSQLQNLDQRVDAWLATEGIKESRIGEWGISAAREHLRSFSNGSKSVLALTTAHPSDRQGRWALFERTMMRMIADITVGLVRTPQ